MNSFLRRLWRRAEPRHVRGVHAYQPMQQRLEIERGRALRAQRDLAVLILSYSPQQDPHGACAVRLADRILQRVRATDELGWMEHNHLGVILPDTQRSGAQRVADDIRRLCQDDLPEPHCVIFFQPGGDPADDGDADAHGDHGNSLAALLGSPAHGNGNGNGNGHGHATQHRADHDHGGVAVAQQTTAAVATAAPPRPVAPPNALARPVERPAPEASLDELFVQPMPFWKRSLDIVGALVGLALLSPLLFAVAVIVKLTSRGGVLFAQRRTGLGGKPFTVYKFRTMYVGAHQDQEELREYSIQDGPAFKLLDDPRTTGFGRILRMTSIDELPQLWNVLRGEMSLVGPRPLPVAEASACRPWQQRRHEVTPGLTCTWQVWGRSRVSFDEWIRMDLDYVNHVSPSADLALIAATIPAVLMRRGAR